MAYRNFEEMVQQVKAAPVMRDLAVAAAADKPVLEAAIRALREGIANPIFVGSAEKITALLQELGEDPKQFRIQDCAEGEEGQAAVELVKDGKASLIMKGLMETRQILSPVVKKENGLRTGELMSHVVFFQLPNYHKLLMTTDGGMVIYPSLEEKVHIVENAVTALHAMGYENPKLAVVAGIEKVNPKMPETTDAAALKHKAGLIAADDAAVGAASAEARMAQRDELGRDVEHIAQQAEDAPGDGAVLRLDGQALFAAAPDDDGPRGGDDAGELREQAADAVRLKAAKLLLRLR